MQDQEWALCAAELGLEAYETPALQSRDARTSFSARLRARTRRARGPVTSEHMLVGTRNGRRFVLEQRGSASAHA